MNDDLPVRVWIGGLPPVSFQTCRNPITPLLILYSPLQDATSSQLETRLKSFNVIKGSTVVIYSDGNDNLGIDPRTHQRPHQLTLLSQLQERAEALAMRQSRTKPPIINVTP